jgi:DNA invertase Pin-like site-specific DNA recombinase
MLRKPTPSPQSVRQPTVKVALYGRCSTNETKQDVENQFIQLREACDSKGWQIVREYVDYESGRKGRDKRQDFDKMLTEASQGVFQLLYFWRLDRFSREGIRQTIHYLELLNDWNIKFKSHTETYLDTDNELISHILLGVISYFAEQEAVKISENTKIGVLLEPTQKPTLRNWGKGQPTFELTNRADCHAARVKQNGRFSLLF